MLFVHLIYVLANYIGVLVLLAEKCRVFSFFFFFSVCWLLSKQKKTNPCSILHCWKLGVTSPNPPNFRVLQPSSCSGADVRSAICNRPLSGDGGGDGLLIRWRATFFFCVSLSDDNEPRWRWLQILRLRSFCPLHHSVRRSCNGRVSFQTG